MEGTYTEFYPSIPQDEEGMKRLFKQFSFPGGIPSHDAPNTPGSINEGGELGYSLGHAYGAVFDNPDLLALCVVGDGEAETGPLATSWHSNKFLDPKSDGAVLPVLHLNGFKIANPTVLARIGDEELTSLMVGYGYKPHFVEGDDPQLMHQQFAATLETVISEIKAIQHAAREKGVISRPAWPMIIMRSPKGWTCPKFVDGKKTEGSWRAHQVPIPDMNSPEHIALLEEWMRGYKPEELFDANGKLLPEIAALAPEGNRRMGANPYANGGLLLKDLPMPNFRDYAIPVEKPGVSSAESTRNLGHFLREIMKLSDSARNFRMFSPDENNSNRLEAVLEVTGRAWDALTEPDDDEDLKPDGRLMEILSETTSQGWLEGYLLTGRHGFFYCYEAFIHIVDSMFNQHAKWLEACHHIPWRAPIASLNYLLTSHVWRQDHNGFSHQDPGFIDHVMNKKASIVRVYLPPDANCLLSVTDHCLRSRNYVNVIVAGKQPELQYLDIDSAVKHCTAGVGIWEWACNDGGDPDVVVACAGDIPTLEALAAVDILRTNCPNLKIRFVNVVDLMTLQPQSEHPHGLSDKDFDGIFTTDRPVIFNYHGYPYLIHRLTYRRTNHDNFHVRGYKEEGTTTTPFDMSVLNQIDRFDLVQDVIDRVPSLGYHAAALKQMMRDRLIDHHAYVTEYGEDMPEIRNWVWPH
jgi:xylulose-5-phosphate/fructose-6-phosphate phosphoketolase